MNSSDEQANIRMKENGIASIKHLILTNEVVDFMSTSILFYLSCEICLKFANININNNHNKINERYENNRINVQYIFTFEIYPILKTRFTL